MILVVAVALLACVALAYVALPIGSRRRLPVEPLEREGELDALKTSALSAIVDLEADRSVGKLSDEDFEVLRAQYEAEALRALVELDALRGQSEPPEDDRALEEEIAAMRVRLECPRCGGLRSTQGDCPQCL